MHQGRRPHLVDYLHHGADFLEKPFLKHREFIKFDFNSSLLLLCVKLAYPNAAWSSFNAASSHPTWSSSDLSFSLHSVHFSNPCASKSTVRIFVVWRLSLSQVLSAAKSSHSFCRSSTSLSCLTLRDSRKFPTLNIWDKLMEIWKAESPHTFSYT